VLRGRCRWAHLIFPIALLLATPIPSARFRPGGADGAAPGAAAPRAAVSRAATPPAAAAGTAGVPAAPVPPADLPVFGYRAGPSGLPADTAGPGAVAGSGLRPIRRVVVHDAPGGRPRAVLKRAISGLPVTVPVVARRSGWVAVLLPSVNRRIGWVPPGGWTAAPLRDHLVVRRGVHELAWYRAGVHRASWTIATGAPATPTPLGRTFVLGRTRTSGAVYAGLDALVLASVPENRRHLPAALRGAHTGIHAWYRGDAFGHSVSNGCLRMPPAAQRTLLRHIPAGTPVTVVD
jgi:lipoprotein-anchoring transpeptidase ErfK/SrfK